MYCPICAAKDTSVIDSRLAASGNQVRRRRECITCKMRFTTYESAEIAYPFVIKNSGEREQFNSEKLRIAFEKALQKRPVSAEQLEEAIAHVQRNLSVFNEREIASRVIGEWVMAELRALDEVAYIRFASVYRKFKDPQAFVEEIERMQGELLPAKTAETAAPSNPPSRRKTKKRRR